MVGGWVVVWVRWVEVCMSIRWHWIRGRNVLWDVLVFADQFVMEIFALWCG